MSYIKQLINEKIDKPMHRLELSSLDYSRRTSMTDMMADLLKKSTKKQENKDNG